MKLKQIARALVRGELTWSSALRRMKALRKPEEQHAASQPRNGTKRGSHIWLAALSLATISLLTSAANAASFQEANRAFAEGRFQEAASGYEHLLAERGFSAPLLFNLANAYLRDGKAGLAILNYERALLLDPNDADLTANLNFARAQAGLFTDGQASSWASAVHLLSLNGWAWLGSASLVVLCGGLLAVRIWPVHKLYLHLLNTISACAVIAAALAITVGSRDLDRAVILTEATARISPFEAARSAFVLAPGETVRVNRTHGGYHLVRTRDERTGWIDEQKVARVVSSDRAKPATSAQADAGRQLDPA